MEPLLLFAAPLLTGVVLALSLAAPPGPVNAMIAHEGARGSLRAGLLTGVGAITGDLAMFLLMYLGVLRLVGGLAWTQAALAGAGCVLLAYFAFASWRSASRPVDPHPNSRGSFWKSFGIVITSPFNWGWWLTVGAALFVELGVAVVLGFFVGLLGWVASWALLTRLGASRFPRFPQVIAYGSAIILALFAARLAWIASGEVSTLLR